MKSIALVAALAAAVSVVAAQQAGPTGPVTAFINARVITADGPSGFEARPATLVVSGGKVVGVQPATDRRLVVSGAQTDLGGQFVVPGLIDAHAHVSAVQGLKPPAYTIENATRQLALYARY